MNSLQRRHLLWILLAGSLLSLGAGFLFSRTQTPLDLECGGRSALLLPGAAQQRWLLFRYDLDLRAEELGDIKARLRLFDAASGQDLGYQNRTARFSYQRQEQRLLLQVLQSSDSQTDNLPLQQLTGVGLFIFNERQHLSYPVRQLDPNILLLDPGQGGALFCMRHPSRR